MANDSFAAEKSSLPGDPDNYPVLCSECERHVTNPYSHRRDCPNWGDTQSEWRTNDGE